MSFALGNVSSPALFGQCCLLSFTARAVTQLVRFHCHDRRQQSEALSGGQRLVILCPTFGLAFDALAVGEVLSRVSGPVRAVDVVVVPEFLRTWAAPSHGL